MRQSIAGRVPGGPVDVAIPDFPDEYGNPSPAAAPAGAMNAAIHRDNEPTPAPGTARQDGAIHPAVRRTTGIRTPSRDSLDHA